MRYDLYSQLGETTYILECSPSQKQSSPGWQFVFPSQIPANTLSLYNLDITTRITGAGTWQRDPIGGLWFLFWNGGEIAKLLGDLWGDGFALCSLSPRDTRAIYSNMIRGPVKVLPRFILHTWELYFSLSPCKKIQQPAFLADGWLRSS